MTLTIGGLVSAIIGCFAVDSREKVVHPWFSGTA